MTINSPFTEYFIDALKQQYIFACRTRHNEKGLKEILLKQNFSEEDLSHLFIVATMSQNDIDSGTIKTVSDAVKEIEKHDVSCICPNCVKNK